MTTKSANNIPTTPVSRKMAGKISKQLLMCEEGTPEYLAAFEKAQRWRAQHALPTENCFRTLLGTTSDFPEAVLTFRLKRMKSMLAKIKRPEGHYQIGTMDDIGGCRMILKDMDQVEDAIDMLAGLFTLKQGSNSIKNYIEEPRRSGYRSCHLITVNPGEDRDYRVEVQIRTKLQHLWSTAVEAASFVYESNFKAEKSLEEVDSLEREIRVFFTIVSSLFALEEGTPQVRGFAAPASDLVRELKRLQRLEDIIEDLSNAEDGVYLSENGTQFDMPGFYLMRFATDLQFLDIGYFGENRLEKALSAYDECESIANTEGKTASLIDYDDVVLAYAQDGEQLSLAFPNYSTRISEFLDRVNSYL